MPMASAARTSDADEPLARLGDDLLRAQRATGIAPTEPADEVFPQSYGPRLAEARRRLAGLGYPRGASERELIAGFRRDAGLAGAGADRGPLDAATWAAIDELTGLEAEVDASRWKDPQGRWLPAMRRAIGARSEALGIRGPRPLDFGADDEDDAAPPTDDDAEDDLRSVREALAGSPPADDELVRLLFNHELLFRRTSAGADEVLTFGGDDRPGLCDRLFDDELARLGIRDDAAIDAAGRVKARGEAAAEARAARQRTGDERRRARQGARDEGRSGREEPRDERQGGRPQRPPEVAARDAIGDDDLTPLALGLDLDDETEREAGREPEGSADADYADAAFDDELYDPEDLADYADDDAAADDEALAFGLGDGLASLRELFRDLIERVDLRKRPNPRQLRAHLASVGALLRSLPDLDERWQGFVADHERVWAGKERAAAWLSGAAKWLRERGLGLVDGLRRLLEGAQAGVAALHGYAEAIFTNLFRVVYHDLARVFDMAHGAASSLVDHTRGTTLRRAGRVQVALRRRARGAVALAAPSASADDLRRVRALLARDREVTALAAELLGHVLGVTAQWALGPVSAAAVLRGLGGRAQRIIYIGQRLVALRAAPLSAG